LGAAFVLVSLEVVRALRGEGHPIAAGTTGENLTLGELDWAEVVPGRVVQVGAARLLITKYTTPCAKVGGSFLGDEFTRISQKLHPGWSRVSARVLEAGIVRIGDPVTVG